MGGLIVLCAILGVVCLVLLIQKTLLNRRIRLLTEQVDGFNSGTAEMLDVALQEDRLAQLQNGIADTQQALARARQLNTEECSRTSQLTADISHQLKTPLTFSTVHLRLFLDPFQERVFRNENPFADIHVGESFRAHHFIGGCSGDSQDFCHIQCVQCQRQVVICFEFTLSQFLPPL